MNRSPRWSGGRDWQRSDPRRISEPDIWWRRRESPGLRACKRESASATAVTEVELLSLSRVRFDQIAGNHKRLGVTLINEVACVLASRLRQTNDEL